MALHDLVHSIFHDEGSWIRSVTYFPLREGSGYESITRQVRPHEVPFHRIVLSHPSSWQGSEERQAFADLEGLITYTPHVSHLLIADELRKPGEYHSFTRELLEAYLEKLSLTPGVRPTPLASLQDCQRRETGEPLFPERVVMRYDAGAIAYILPDRGYGALLTAEETPRGITIPEGVERLAEELALQIPPSPDEAKQVIIREEQVTYAPGRDPVVTRMLFLTGPVQLPLVKK